MVKFQASCFAEANIAKVYIAYDAYGLTLSRYDVNAKGFDIRVSIVQPEEFDNDKVAKAYSLHKQAFKQVLIYSN